MKFLKILLFNIIRCIIYFLPINKTVYLFYINLLIELKKDDKALSLLCKLTNKYKAKKIYRLIFDICFKQNNYEKFCQVYQNITNNINQSLYIHLYMALTYRAKGDIVKLEEYVHKLKGIIKRNIDTDIKDLLDIGYKYDMLYIVEKLINNLDKQVLLSQNITQHIIKYYMRVGNFSSAKKYLAQDPQNILYADFIEKLDKITLDNFIINNYPDDIFKYIYDNCVVNYKKNNIQLTKQNKKMIVFTGSLGTGGAESKVVSLLLSMQKDTTFDVQCCALELTSDKHRFFLKELELNNITVFHLNDEDKKINMDALQQQYTIFINAINLIPSKNGKKIIINTINLLLRQKPDIIRLSAGDGINVYIVLAALIVGIPLINISITGETPEERYPLYSKGKLKRYIKNFYSLLANNDNILFTYPSYKTRESYKQWLNIDMKNTYIAYRGLKLPNIISTENRNILKGNLNIPFNGIIIGNIARIDINKNPLLWVNTAVLLLLNNKNFYFIYIGKVDDKILYQKIKSVVKFYNFERYFIFINSVEKEEINKYYQIFNLFFLSSTNEGLPNVLLEAQVNGIPVITTNAGGSQEALIEGQTGFLVDKNDHPEQIANKIIEILDNKEFMKDIQKKTRAFIAEKFYPNRLVDDTLKSYGIKK